MQDEAQKLKMKVSKVVSYWKRQSLLIPNVFRLAREIEDDALHLLEHQDLSRKELLVQSNGLKAKGSSIYCESDDELAELSSNKSHKTPSLAKKPLKKTKHL